MWLFHVARAWVAVGHFLAFANGIAVIMLHDFLIRNSYVGLSLRQVSESIPNYYVPVVAFATIGSIGHFMLICHSLLASRRRLRNLRTGPAPAANLVTVVPNPRSVSVAPLVLTRAMSSRSRVKSKVQQQAHRVYGIWTAYHAEITWLFIIWEISLQTFQANKISNLIASKWINRLMAFILAVNCWFAPVIHYALRRHPPAFVRLCRLLVDSVIDLVYGIGIPLSIFYPYYHEYNGSISLFPIVNYHADTWYVSAISELRQVFVSGNVDFISKITGAIAFITRLFLVQEAISAAEREATTSHNSLGPALPIREIKGLLRRLLDTVLILWGCGVLAIHVHATVTSVTKHNTGCLLELRPWGATTYTCASLEISCSKWHTNGEMARIQEALEHFDHNAVQILILSNCPNLSVPPRVQLLQSLITLKIYNSSIVDWTADAALQHKHHPVVQMVMLVRVNMTEMPDGLLADDFPSTIWSLHLSHTSLLDFPDKIATLWTGVQLVAVDGNPSLTDIPPVLAQLPNIQTLGFRGTRIQTVSKGALDHANLMFFSLAGNPLTELPDSMGNPTRLSMIDFRKTQIRSFPPSWSLYESSYPVVFQSAGTPLCTEWVNQKQLAPSWLVVDCFSGANEDADHFYPIAEEDQWRRANQ